MLFRSTRFAARLNYSQLEFLRVMPPAPPRLLDFHRKCPPSFLRGHDLRGLARQFIDGFAGRLRLLRGISDMAGTSLQPKCEKKTISFVPVAATSHVLAHEADVIALLLAARRNTSNSWYGFHLEKAFFSMRSATLRMCSSTLSGQRTRVLAPGFAK